MEFKFKCRLFLVLTYFDDVFGPQVISSEPSQMDESILEMVRKLMDIASVGKQEEFIYSNRKFSSQNIFFSLSNPDVRGGMTDFLVSLILSPTYPHVVSVISMDWNSLLDLIDAIRDDLEKFCEEGNMHLLQKQVGGVMETRRSKMLETLNFELEILSPESYVVE